jgi:F-type H+-transporting ATPase subunit delta
MPKLLPQQYAKVLYELTKDAENVDDAITTFIQFLKKEQAVKKVPHIMKYFEAYAKEQEGIAQIHVTGARDLSDKVLKEVGDAFGSNTEVTTEVDPAIIGGVVVRSKNTILDGSIKTQLELLKREMV